MSDYKPMEIVSRAQAKQIGQKFFFTGKLCKNGHRARRRVANGVCGECQTGYSKANARAVAKAPRQQTSLMIFQQAIKNNTDERDLVRIWQEAMRQCLPEYDDEGKISKPGDLDAIKFVMSKVMPKVKEVDTNAENRQVPHISIIFETKTEPVPAKVTFENVKDAQVEE